MPKLCEREGVRFNHSDNHAPHGEVEAFCAWHLAQEFEVFAGKLQRQLAEADRAGRPDTNSHGVILSIWLDM